MFSKLKVSFNPNHFWSLSLKFNTVLSSKVHPSALTLPLYSPCTSGHSIPISGPFHAAFIIPIPEAVDIITELCLITQHQKSMCKAFRDKELLCVFSRQHYAIPLAVDFRAASQINCNIEHPAAYSTNQLALQLYASWKCRPPSTSFVDID